MNGTGDPMTALSETEVATFETVLAAARDDRLFAMRCRLDGIERVVLAYGVDSPDGSIGVYPLAVLVVDDLFDHIEPVGDAVEVTS